MFCKLQIYLTQNSNEDLSCTKWYGNQVAIKVSVGLLFQKQHILLEITEASDNPQSFIRWVVQTPGILKNQNGISWAWNSKTA